MKVSLIISFILSSLLSHSQSVSEPFDSKIIAYYGIGFYIPKAQNQVIVSSHGLRFREDSTHFIIVSGKQDDNYLILGNVSDTDTTNRQRFEFQFIPIEKPRLKFKCQNEFESGNPIVLHKDSLDQLKEFYLQNYRITSPPAEWKIHKAEVYYKNQKGRPPLIKESSVLPDDLIDSLQLLGDSFKLYMVLNVSMQDEIRRLITDSVSVVLMEGLQYERYVDPRYDYKRHKDTVLLSPLQLEETDTIRLINPGHLFIGFPRLKRDYEINLDDGICYGGFGEEYTMVKKGKGYLIYDAYNAKGIHTLHIHSKGRKENQIVIIE